MKKYGLQLRADPSQQKKKPSRPPLAPPPSAFFQDDDDDDGGIESEIARHATKNKSLRDIEEQHKKALAEDPSVFDYDGVYDEMKEETVRPREQDRQERKSKYIEALMNKAKVREREHEIIYERKLAKERSKDDHLFADKEKFVTSAYKKKLAEQAKWLEEERIRQLREEKDDVTKKSDLSDFYFNITKNVAFGGKAADSKKPMKQERRETVENTPEVEKLPAEESPNSARGASSSQAGSANLSQNNLDSLDKKSVPVESLQKEIAGTEQQPDDQAMQARHKRTEDALAAAKERYLSRKRAKEQ
ncbi:nuclear speckle splicing regulatory protein 1 isoform X1 [Cinnamomum micranthum f. kanehirae]|uniref:Nuclear speckle splicing regulatory protein 1 isoform X1 n=1 Tax=Cinnamomum micranthum f. kanehirae TaxID=337451 RepID=A0A3S3NPZ9_9MAGN|nr:nuclear speckle splicing regulatory protein 1 isoform X1 [Cinnamomum micranthum f. kanehirae]